jgi:hypothetical protein
VPIRFALPPETRFWVAPRFSLAPIRSRDGRREDVLVFGVRPVGEGPAFRHAVEISFLWITPRIRGADAERLSALHRGIANARSAERFLATVFYFDRPHVTLREGGLLPVGSRDARRVFVDWRTLVGTPHERRVAGEAVVLPVHPAAVLVVLGRFDEAATREEREIVFPGIVRSIRLQGEVEL